MIKETVCTTCPNSCFIRVLVEKGSPVRCEGQQCPRGEIFAFDEILSPKRILTTTVPVKTDQGVQLLPVRSAGPVPRDLQKKIVSQLASLNVVVPIKMGQILVENVLDTGVAIIASKNIP